MLVFLLLAGLSLEPIEVGEEVLDVRVVDLVADGHEDVVAVTKEHLYLFPDSAGPPVKRPAPPLTVVGRGLCGVVRDGIYREVKDPFGAWKETPTKRRSLLAGLGHSRPGLLASPGDIDGDGRDDLVLPVLDGFATAAGLVPMAPAARLAIKRNELFAVEYHIPVPVVGSWTGGARELVFFHDGLIESFRGVEPSDNVPLPLPTRGRDPESIRRNHVFLRDIDGDGRLDLVVVVAKGSTGFFGSFEATARYWHGGRVYHRGKKGFYRPISFLKVEGALLRPELIDLDSDGDLDLVLSTINTSILAAATGTAPGTYHLFRFEERAYRRNPAWTYRAPVPLSAFTAKPQPPVRFLPDLDGNGRPEALAIATKSVRLLEANRKGRFRRVDSVAVDAAGHLAVGATCAALGYEKGIVVVGASR